MGMPDPEKAPVVVEMFERYATGCGGYLSNPFRNLQKNNVGRSPQVRYHLAWTKNPYLQAEYDFWLSHILAFRLGMDTLLSERMDKTGHSINNFRIPLRYAAKPNWTDCRECPASSAADRA